MHSLLIHKTKNTNLFIFTEKNRKFKIKSNYANIVFIPMKRNPSFIDILSILYYSYFRLKYRPILSISFTPKGSLVNISTCWLPGNSIHYFTGQRWATFKGLKKKFFKFIDFSIIKLSNSCYSDSFSQSEYISRELRTDPPKVIHHGSLSGVNTKIFTPQKPKINQIKNHNEKIIYKKFLRFISENKEQSIFAFIGRISADKGISECLDAFIEHSKIFPLSKLLFIGPLELNKNQKFNFPNNKQYMHINFTENVHYYLPHITCLILPSYREGFGTVLLEAAACKIASIATDIPGPRDFIKHLNNGYLIRPYSVSDKIGYGLFHH